MQVFFSSCDNSIFEDIYLLGLWNVIKNVMYNGENYCAFIYYNFCISIVTYDDGLEEIYIVYFTSGEKKCNLLIPTFYLDVKCFYYYYYYYNECYKVL